MWQGRFGHHGRYLQSTVGPLVVVPFWGRGGLLFCDSPTKCNQQQKSKGGILPVVPPGVQTDHKKDEKDEEAYPAHSYLLCAYVYCSSRHMIA
jgi:hypothetical protein